MKKLSLILAVILISFCLGFNFKSFLSNKTNNKPKKVTGIGGIFFKCKDPQKTKEWYSKNLGLNTDKYGSVFGWYQGADSTKKGYTQWSPFSEKTKYFAPSTKDFMINYRVENLENLVKEFKENGVTVCDSIETHNYGKFVHIMDIEGNKIELWQPNDDVFGRIEGARTY